MQTIGRVMSGAATGLSRSFWAGAMEFGVVPLVLCLPLPFSGWMAGGCIAGGGGLACDEHIKLLSMNCLAASAAIGQRTSQRREDRDAWAEEHKVMLRALGESMQQKPPGSDPLGRRS